MQVPSASPHSTHLPVLLAALCPSSRLPGLMLNLLSPAPLDPVLVLLSRHLSPNLHLCPHSIAGTVPGSFLCWTPCHCWLPNALIYPDSSLRPLIPPGSLQHFPLTYQQLWKRNLHRMHASPASKSMGAPFTRTPWALPLSHSLEPAPVHLTFGWLVWKDATRDSIKGLPEI